MPDIEPFTPTFNPDGTLDIDELLTYAVRNGASDLHLANQLPPAIRIDGSLRPIEGLGRVDNEQIREMVYRILTQNLRERFEAEKELDTAHTIMGVGRFRVNVFQQRGLDRNRHASDPARDPAVRHSRPAGDHSLAR